MWLLCIMTETKALNWSIRWGYYLLWCRCVLYKCITVTVCVSTFDYFRKDFDMTAVCIYFAVVTLFDMPLYHCFANVDGKVILWEFGGSLKCMLRESCNQQLACHARLVHWVNCSAESRTRRWIAGLQGEIPEEEGEFPAMKQECASVYNSDCVCVSTFDLFWKRFWHDCS